MYSCKLGSLALLLALSASHHFILLHCQGSGIAPDSDYGGPPPTPRPESDSYYSSPPSPPLESAPAQAPIRLIAGALEPTESGYGSLLPPLPPSLPRSPALASATNWEPALYSYQPQTESAPVQILIVTIVKAVIGLVVASSVCFCIWRRRRARQSAQPQPPKEEDLVSGAAAPSSSEYKDNGKD
ncbi:hypothetical protein K1719_021253 [Acacia pycnantha]|nr:hypothetical protein K1719_021253 [Acacia pycnantha]